MSEKPAGYKDNRERWFAEQVASLKNARFYGKVTLHFEQGRVIRLVKEESLKPPQ